MDAITLTLATIFTVSLLFAFKDSWRNMSLLVGLISFLLMPILNFIY